MVPSDVSSSVLSSPSGTLAERPGAEREIAAQFQALLMRAALAPLANAMGFYGDVVVDEATRRIARGVP